MSEDRYENLEIQQVLRPEPQSLPNFSMRIVWFCPSLGWGQVDLWWDGDKLCADTEHMSAAFMERLMSLLAKKIEIRW